MRITFKLYGVYRTALGSDSITLSPRQPRPTVRTVIEELVARSDCKELKRLILDEQSSDPRSNSIILLDGREIGALNGLETSLKENNELSLLPIAHGG